MEAKLGILVALTAGAAVGGCVTARPGHNTDWMTPEPTASITSGSGHHDGGVLPE